MDRDAKDTFGTLREGKIAGLFFKGGEDIFVALSLWNISFIRLTTASPQ
jgi:hypothetical protein